jgi:hypothetical protein
VQLRIQLEKQLLAWCKAEGYKPLKDFDLRAAQSFRASWTDDRLARRKKQERLTGFSGSVSALADHFEPHGSVREDL